MIEQQALVLGGDKLATVLDHHLLWIGHWHRAVFYGTGSDDVLTAAPAAFAAWSREAHGDGFAKQPVVERLTTLHEQMHRMARQVLLKAEHGAPPTAADYEAVIGRYEAFLTQVRRVERAISTAAAGLDVLTGLPGRSAMMEELQKAFQRFRRSGDRFSIAIADVDHFKQVNDRYGHDAGDRVLQAIADSLSRGVRGFDEVYRMGGEEFLLYLKGAALTEGYRVVERLRQGIASTPISVSGDTDTTLTVTVSLGMAQVDAASNLDRLIILADQALYRAKDAGRNRVMCDGLEEETSVGMSAAGAPEGAPIGASAGAPPVDANSDRGALPAETAAPERAPRNGGGLPPPPPAWAAPPTRAPGGKRTAGTRR